jgi:Ca2+-binding RTX toxin-like protein
MQIHLLECRRLMTATVNETYPGYFEVTGDESDDAIVISVDQGQQSFALDGVTYTGVSYISVFGNGGNDTIKVSAASPGAIGASIDGGGGDDDLSLDIDGGLWGGDGNDTLRLDNSFQGEVHGDAGDDRMFVGGDCFDAQLLGGDGNDLIDASANHYAVVIRGGEGDDIVYGSQYDDRIYADGGEDVLYGLGGNDTFYCRDAYSDQIFGGAGTDFAYIDTLDVPRRDVEYVMLYDG